MDFSYVVRIILFLHNELNVLLFRREKPYRPLRAVPWSHGKNYPFALIYAEMISAQFSTPIELSMQRS